MKRPEIKSEVAAKLRSGIPQEPRFVLPENYGPDQATEVEVEQLLEATWEQFRKFSFSQMRNLADYLKATELEDTKSLQGLRHILKAAREAIKKEEEDVNAELAGRWNITGARCLIEEKNGKTITRVYLIEDPVEVETQYLKAIQKRKHRLSLIEFRTSILGEVMWQYAAYGYVPHWKDYWIGLSTDMQNAIISNRGRKPGIEDFPEEVLALLEAIFEYTSIEKNRDKHVKSEKGLFGFIAKRLSRGEYSMPLPTVESRVKAAFKQVSEEYNLSLVLPQNTGRPIHSYFGIRDVIGEAIEILKAELFKAESSE